MGGQRSGPTQPAHPTTPTPGTPLTWHHVSVTEQTALLSMTGSNFLLSLSLPPLFRSLMLFFFFSPSLPLSFSLFVLFSRTTKGRQSQGWRHPSSLWPFKKTAPLPTPSCTWIDDTHIFIHSNLHTRTHMHTHAHTHTYIGPLSVPPALHWPLISFYSKVCMHTVKQPAMILFCLIHTNMHTHTQPQKNWLPTHHLSTARWEVRSYRHLRCLPLTSWLTAISKIILP